MPTANKTYTENEREYLESIEAEIENHRAEIHRLENIKNIILKKSSNILKKSENDIPILKSTTNSSGYPVNGERPEKVVAILRENNRVLLQREIEDSIRKLEGTKSQTTLKSFYYILNDKMLKGGIVCFLRVANSYKYAFYALPEWLDENKRIKAEYMPREEAWGNFPASKRKKIETEKWKIYPMKK